MDQIVLNAFLYLDAKMENVSIIQIHVFVIQDGVATYAMNLIARNQYKIFKKISIHVLLSRLIQKKT